LRIEATRGELAEAEQALATAATAKQTLDTFEQIGASELTLAQKDTGMIGTARGHLASLLQSISDVAAQARSFPRPKPANADIAEIACSPSVLAAFRRFRATMRLARMLVVRMDREFGRAEVSAEIREEKTKQDVQEALVKAGGSAEDLNRFDDLTRLASAFEAATSVHKVHRASLRGMLREFRRLRKNRDQLVEQHRTEMAKLGLAMDSRFGGAIRLSQIKDGIRDNLERWLLDLKEKGITRWWNDLGALRYLASPATMLRLLKVNHLECLGMSAQVSATFRECMTAKRKVELYSLRNEDYYELQMRVADNPPAYKRMEELSGGAQVSLLLTLLLSSENNCPLVIDQPEDELDKSYLRDTVLPALRRLKGRRQVILATHDANIVVNGDADQVIYLTATHDYAGIAEQDAIENRAIKNAIIDLLDGGSEAFEMRKEKYGF
jgi:hypothetical protein